ncbi:MAG: hypothetical protein HRT40_13340, partial [Campylobacteraceae bacterium]|nr:hypothetical protein [Campylobacteraceae bacterium]
VVDATESLAKNTTDDKTSQRMNELYADDSASRVQGYLASEKVAEGVMSLTGVTAIAKAGLKKVLLPNRDKNNFSEKMGLGEDKKPNPKVIIEKDQDILLSSKDGLEIRTPSDGKGLFTNTKNDGKTTHLFTIDKNGVKVIPEKTSIGENDVVKHTNLRSQASFGGEVKFTSDGKVILNPYSGRYGVGNSKDDLETQKKLEITKKVFEDIGYNKVDTEFSPKTKINPSIRNKDSDSKVFFKNTFTGLSGRTYNFYGQNIDLDLKILNKRTNKVETNRERMKKGNNPYIKDRNGNIVATEQYHSQQKAGGPIFEIRQTTHKNQKNQKVLHPYAKKKNPNEPVDHKNEWNKDRKSINKQRVKKFEEEGK